MSGKQYIVYVVTEFFWWTAPALRIIAMRHRKHTVESIVSDVFLLMTWIVGVVECILNVWFLVIGDKIKAEFPPEVAYLKLTAPLYLKIYFAEVILYTAMLWMLKAGFVAMYYGLFGANSVDRIYRQALHFTTILIIVSFFVDVIATVLWCQPIHDNWSLGPKSCSAAFHYERSTILYATNVATDILILLLPLAVFHKLNIRRREKVALLAVFGVGAFTIIASTIRYAVIYDVVRHPSDKVKEVQKLEIWSTIECAAAMVAFCLPAYRNWFSAFITFVAPYYEKYVPRSVVQFSYRAGSRVPGLSHHARRSIGSAPMRNHEMEDLSILESQLKSDVCEGTKSNTSASGNEH